jgi:hypothetical protein
MAEFQNSRVVLSFHNLQLNKNKSHRTVWLAWSLQCPFSSISAKASSQVNINPSENGKKEYCIIIVKKSSLKILSLIKHRY